MCQIWNGGCCVLLLVRLLSGATAEVLMVNEECQYDGIFCIGRMRGEVVSTVFYYLYCAGRGSLL